MNEWVDLAREAPAVFLALYVIYELRGFRVDLNKVHDRLLRMLGRALDDVTDSHRRAEDDED